MHGTLFDRLGILFLEMGIYRRIEAPLEIIF